MHGRFIVGLASLGDCSCVCCMICVLVRVVMSGLVV
jgi:hypothetical protein